MTRFLSRIWTDPLCGSLNGETERLFAYHQATKHTYQSVRSGGHPLDWNNQPDPFRSYQGASAISLLPDPGFPDAGTFATVAALAEDAAAAGTAPEGRQEIQLNPLWLSRLLWHSMAISARKKVPGTGNRYSLRVNPSSGNLHPTETYLALRGCRELANGLYHYRPDSHSIELRKPGDIPRQLAGALTVPWAEESQLIVALTSVFWREAWKYRDRAYRYCCHDLGHAAMSLLLAARALGLPGGVIAHFGDAGLMRALGLGGGDEAPMAFLVFPPKTSTGDPATAGQHDFSGVPNELSAREVPYPLLLDIHRATILPDSVEPLAMHPPAAGTSDQPSVSRQSPPDPVIDAALGGVVRRRRSALDFDPRSAPMAREELEQLLDFATRDWRADWRGNFHGRVSDSFRGVDFVSLLLYVHRVKDCDPGVYQWDSAHCRLELLHRGNVQRVAAYLSLEQALAGNSCFTISMIADLAKAARIFGNRGYRYVHFEAGAIGQRLYVGAEALNWNATGIGAFYDDDAHRYLGFLEDTNGQLSSSLDAAEKRSLVMLDSPSGRRAALQEPASATLAEGVFSAEAAAQKDSQALARQVVYHFAVGRAVPDPRLEG